METLSDSTSIAEKLPGPLLLSVCSLTVSESMCNLGLRLAASPCKAGTWCAHVLHKSGAASLASQAMSRESAKEWTYYADPIHSQGTAA